MNRLMMVCLVGSWAVGCGGFEGDSPPSMEQDEAIGAACVVNGQCADGACLPWPGGYCTRVDCMAAGCPGDAVCAPLRSWEISGCLEHCDADTDCRTDVGYACDPVLGACRPRVVADACTPVAHQPGYNQFVVSAINDSFIWPKDSTYPYCWMEPGCGGSWGFIHDGDYGGAEIFPGGGDCFCTGHMLEIFLDSWRRYRSAFNLPDAALFGQLTVDELDQGDFYRHWQGIGTVASSAQAFVSADIGFEFGQNEWGSVLPGDFLNLSRDPPSGHSAIFIDWVRNGTGNIIGLRYFACNGWGDSCPSEADPENKHGITGPSFATEYFYGMGGTVVPRYLFIGRLNMP